VVPQVVNMQIGNSGAPENRQPHFLNISDVSRLGARRKNILAQLTILRQRLISDRHQQLRDAIKWHRVIAPAFQIVALSVPTWMAAEREIGPPHAEDLAAAGAGHQQKLQRARRCGVMLRQFIGQPPSLGRCDVSGPRLLWVALDCRTRVVGAQLLGDGERQHAGQAGDHAIGLDALASCRDCSMHTLDVGLGEVSHLHGAELGADVEPDQTLVEHQGALAPVLGADQR
jgi:hypothetical protein